MPHITLQITLLCLKIKIQYSQGCRNQLRSISKCFSKICHSPRRISTITIIQLQFSQNPCIFASLIRFPTDPFLQLALQSLFFLYHFQLFYRLIHAYTILPIVRALCILGSIFNADIITFFHCIFPDSLLDGTDINHSGIIRINPFVYPK